MMRPPEPPRAWVHVSGTEQARPGPLIAELASMIGAALATARFALQIGDAEGVDRLTGEAFLEGCKRAGLDPADRLRVLTRGRAGSTWPRQCLVQLGDHGGAYVEQLEHAAAVVLLDGPINILPTFDHALDRGLPAFPLPASGSVAARLFDDLLRRFDGGGAALRRAYRGLGAGDLEPLRDTDPARCVEALIRLLEDLLERPLPAEGAEDEAPVQQQATASQGPLPPGQGQQHVQAQQVQQVQQAPLPNAPPEAPPAPAEDARPADDPAGARPLADLDAFLWSSNARLVIDAAIKLAASPRARRVTTSDLLYAFADVGDHVAGNLTPRLVREALSGAGSRYEESRRAFVGAQTESGEGASAALIELAEEGTRISREAGDRGEISCWTILVAVFTRRGSAPLGFELRLAEAGSSLDRLRDAYADYVRRNLRPEHAARWIQRISGERRRPDRGAAYANDSVGRLDRAGEHDPDPLAIGPDIDAFAALICSRQTQPPLSIGLFGEWGSGKTYFMRRLEARIDELARGAESPSFHRDVVQIEFNAWQYIEGNLWASLVEHIFRNIRPAGGGEGDEVQKLRMSLLKALVADEARQKEAADEMAKAREVADSAKKALDEARRQRDEMIEEASVLGAKGAIFTEAKKLLAQAGLSGSGASLDELSAQLLQARALVARGGAVARGVRADMSTPAGRWKLACVGLLLASPVIAVGLQALVKRIGAPEESGRLAAVVGSVVTLATAVLGWVQQHGRAVSDWLTRVDEAQRTIDRTMDSATDAMRKSEDARVKEVADRFDEAKREHDAAVKQEEAAAERMARTKASLEGLTAPRLLSSFLSDRLASNDYRQHLSVTAKIREDFERLSRFVHPDAPSSEPVGIDRIVLYIDDLDRCPPDKVVHVLEAIHLLLAFRLFVVVVGVDARWLAHSLRTHHAAVLGQGQGDSAVNELLELGVGAAATPHDYLEKIFQVPFWLTPMGVDGCRALLADLLDPKPARAEGPKAAAGKQAPGATPKAAGGKKTGKADVAAPGSKPAAKAPPREDEPGSAKGNAAAEKERPAPPDKAAPPVEPAPLAPEQIDLDPLERDFMGELAPLLYRSPRALKRFVNVYRLLKASLRPADRFDYLDATKAPPHHEVVLFLLAVTVGMPSVSRAFFEEVAVYTDDIPDKDAPPADLGELLARMDRSAPDPSKIAGVAWAEEMARIRGWLSARPSKRPFNPHLPQLGYWARRVSRFTYRVNRW